MSIAGMKWLPWLDSLELGDRHQKPPVVHNRGCCCNQADQRWQHQQDLGALPFGLMFVVRIQGASRLDLCIANTYYVSEKVVLQHKNFFLNFLFSNKDLGMGFMRFPLILQRKMREGGLQVARLMSGQCCQIIQKEIIFYPNIERLFGKPRHLM